MTAPTRIRPARHAAVDDTGRRGGGRTISARSTGTSPRPGVLEPVFLDRTGRRRRFVAAAGASVILLLTLMVLALLAGFTGGAPRTMPGWPAADGHPRPARPAPERTEPAPSVASLATATSRPSAPVTRPAKTDQPSGSEPTTMGPATILPATPTASPTRPGNGHGRNPSHTPNPHASKSP
jgi:hypothetical protein